MRQKILILGLVATVALAITSCQSPWLAGGQPYTSAVGGFTVQFPADWTSIESSPGRVTATHDGVFLQRIMVWSHDIKDPLPDTKRMLKENMTPLDVAEAVSDFLRSDHSFVNLSLSSSSPADIAQHPGFRLQAEYHTPDKMDVTEILYGFLYQRKLYILIYEAPTRYYFDRDRAAIDSTVQSFRITAK